MTVTNNLRPTFSSDSIDNLRSRLNGVVILPEDDGFDTARTIWNSMITRSPAIIVQPVSTNDVVAAVQFATAHDMPVAIRGGGHNVAGLGVGDDGLTIDLSRMRAVDVDPERKIAQAQGGATWADFDAATQAHGLATTGGAISMTGVGGLTLGGGLGSLMRSYGLACDNLISAEVVTADGTILTASASENPDLFWGLRGGGGNFGIVTRFGFQLHPVSQVLGGSLLFPIEQAGDMLRTYRQVTATAPDALATSAALLAAPDGTPVCALVVCFNGPIEEGERVIRPYREFATPISDSVGPMPYTAVQSMLDPAFGDGMQNYWRSHFLTDLNESGIATLVDHFARVTSPMSMLLLEHLGGAVARVGNDETAFNYRNHEYNLAMLGRWTNPADADVHMTWTRDVSDAMQPYASGVYVNYLGPGEQADRVRAAYGDEKYARLVGLKNRYDPTNRFRFNQNIKPTA